MATMGLFGKLFGKKEEKQSAAAKGEPAAEGGAGAAEAREEWESQGVPQEMQAAEVRAALEGAHPPLLLDIREPHELEADGWIPGSVHIPMGQIARRLDELDKTRAIVVYCRTGVRSFDVGFLLIEKGFREVANLNGGIYAWDGEIARR